MFSASGGSPILGACGRVCVSAGMVSKATMAPADAVPNRARQERPRTRFMLVSPLNSNPAMRALLQARGAARVAGQFQNVNTCVGAVDDVDVAAIVGLQIVALNRDLAAVLAVDLDAALGRRLGDRRDEVADL